MKKILKYLFVIILILAMIILAGSTFLRYNIKPAEIYKIDFENFNQKPGDCCTTPENAKEAIIFASQSQDSFKERFSLNLTSSNHCACVNKPITNFNKNNKYWISFYYRGDNPSTCVWVTNDNKCLIDKKLESSNKWNKSYSLLIPLNNSVSASIYFYANSDGSRTVTNLYDDLQVHKLNLISNSGPFNSEEQYIIKTNPSNIVSNAEKLNDEGYYLITGAPDITLKFPWTELALIIIMMLIVIRLLFRKQIIHLEEKVANNLKKELKEFR